MSNITITVDEGSSKVILAGIKKDNVEVDYSGDVDFTNLVDVLTNLIDSNKSVEFTIPTEFNEGKISVVLETIGKILTKYNESITTVNDTGQSELDVKEQDSTMKDDDLPF